MFTYGKLEFMYIVKITFTLFVLSTIKKVTSYFDEMFENLKKIQLRQKKMTGIRLVQK